MPKLATLVATTFANFFSLAMAIKTVVAWSPGRHDGQVVSVGDSRLRALYSRLGSMVLRY